MSNIYKYINLESTYRNRNIYPNPADFVAPVNYGPGSAETVFQALDPISNSTPSFISLTNAGSTVTDIVFSTGSTIPNFYINNYLQIGTEFQTITVYNPLTLTATVANPYSAAPGAGVTFYVRQAIPVFSSVLVAGSNKNVLNLGPTASSIDGAYNGYYVYFRSGANITVSRLIVQYNGTTKLAILGKALPNPVAIGDVFDILQYSEDNFSPLIYSGTIGFNQPVCYSIELLYLTIPNQPLSSGYGGSLDNYPFLYLYLYNEGNSHADHALYTNNPNTQSALFKIPLGLTLRGETFFTLKDAKMIQVVKFKPDQALHFRLVLPDGSPIIFTATDTLSPNAPNPLIQISGTFAIRRIDGEHSSGSSSGYRK